MARCRVGDKKVKRLREQTGLDVVGALVRGGTDHRIDLLIAGGTVKHLYKDGTVEESDIRWKQEKL